MKHYKRKLIFAIVASISLSVGILLLAIQEPMIWQAIIFLLAMKGGIYIWIYSQHKESKRLAEENFKRKNK